MKYQGLERPRVRIILSCFVGLLADKARKSS